MKTSLKVSIWKEGKEYVIKSEEDAWAAQPPGLLLATAQYDTAVEAVKVLEAARDTGVVGTLSIQTDSGAMLKELERLKAQRTLYVVRGSDGVFATSLDYDGVPDVYLFLSPAATAEKAARLLNQIAALGKEFTKGEHSYFAEGARQAVGR